MTTYDDYGVPIGAYSEPEGLTHQAWRVARAFYLYRIRPLAGRVFGARGGPGWSFRRLFTLVNALVVLWWVVLFWGETGTFNSAVGGCSWEKWEDWVSRIHIRLDVYANNICRKPAQTHTDSSSSPTRSS